MSTRELAVNAFTKLGVVPSAMELLKSEASDAVVLLAARLATDWYGDPDGFFRNNPPPASSVTYFIGNYDKFSDAEKAENDERAMRMWLKYAGERIRKVERRLIVHALAEGFTKPAARKLVMSRVGETAR